ncbi:MAG TPA: lipid kinase [Beijerinckiaceae bacterium]|nr:lipid kinase [Beijerinckiaceae bacterium]
MTQSDDADLAEGRRPAGGERPAQARPARTHRALLLANRRSRRGAELVDPAVDALRGHGIEVVLADCATREDLAEKILEQAPAIDRVVVAGGDGTMNAAAPALVGTGLPLGILPAGTANDLARTLGIPEDVAAAARIIAEGHIRTIDLGTVNDNPFFNVASIGLSVELTKVLTRDFKRRYGKLGYGLAAFRVLARARPFRATIRSDDGEARVRTLQVAVGNGRYYGGGNAVEKTAAIDDQHLDLYSLEFKQAWKLALLARSFRYGEHGAWDEVRAVRGKEFDILTRSPKPVNADGEIVTQTPAHFRIVPNAVSVFCPRERAEG